MDFEELKIKEYAHWILYLHPNQSYLGRTYLVAKRNGDFDLTDMTGDETKEFITIIKKVKAAVGELFSADRVNFAQYGNDWHHLHVHIIPRYVNPPEREFDGIKFVDIRPTGNYAPYDKDFKLPEQTLNKIIKSLKSKV